MAELTLTGLRVVLAVVDAGSFTGAAEAMGYTQSAISRQVAAMEAAVGGPIFERGRRGATLTPAGRVLARRARQVVSDLAATEMELAGLRDRLAGRLTIGAYPTAAMALVPHAMALMAADHPGLAIVLQEAATPALLRRVRGRRVDVAAVAVGHGLPEHDLGDLRQAAVLRGDLLVAVGARHRLADRASLTTADLVGERWIAGEGAADEPQFGAWPTLPDPDVVHAARSWAVRLGLVAAGLGITTIPGLAERALPADVRAIPVADDTWRGRETLVVTRPDPSAQAQAMVAALQAAASAVRPAAGAG